jgi:LmbE family N-acetylglucosaminyl deacetylase
LIRPFLHFLIFGALLSAAASAQGPVDQAKAPPAAPKPIVDPAHETAGPLPVDTGVSGLKLMLRKLKTTARLMQTTAHPDDEDGGMLAYESRGKGVEVMLLTLTRGDGGQNKTGSNLFDELGVLRTLELLSSDRYYGVEQRFTRAADFGYTKTAQEALDKWKDHDAVLGDMVRAIREFQPDVIASGWQGTQWDGHGQHQATGILTPEALKAAADPNRFPEQLKQGLHPWQAKRLFVRCSAEDATLRIDVSAVDPVLGASYAQYGVEGYSHQRSQNARIFVLPSGPIYRNYKLVWSAPGFEPPEKKQRDFFDGMDMSVEHYSNSIEKEALKEVEDSVSDASRKLEGGDARATAGSLVRALHGSKYTTMMSMNSVQNAEALRECGVKGQQLEDAAALALGLRLEAVPLDANVTALIPGQKVQVKVTLHGGGSDLAVKAFWLARPSGYERYREISKDLTSSEPSAVFEITVPENAELTRPTWHRSDPERQTLHQVSSDADATWPLPSFPISAGAQYVFEGNTANVGAPLTAASNPNTALGVVPAFSLLPEHSSLVVAIKRVVPVSVIVRNNGPDADVTAVRLEGPAISSATPGGYDHHFKSHEERLVDFSVTMKPSLKEGVSQIKADLVSAGKTYTEGFSTISRSDLQTFYYYQPAVQKVSVVDVKLPKKLKVGYVTGAGDDILPVLQEIGLEAESIDPKDLAAKDLSGYDTIVLGIRAYDTQPEVVKNNPRLLDYVQNGGTLIVQNNFSAQDFNAGKFTPYPATLSRGDRVSDENAPVDVLLPQDAVFNYPNQIKQADFAGWVQERGVNFMSDWDAHFEPLLASHDPNEPPLKGGLLRAKFGKGLYIYTGYAFFRQVPAGVPGAIRLYVNLLSAGHEGR